MVATATVTTTTADAFIPTIWSAGVMEAVEFSARLQKRCNRRFESQLRVGEALKVGRISNLTTQTKTSGILNTVVFEAITETQQSITVATHEYAAFLVEDVVNVQSSVDLRSKYEKKIGYALSRGREVSLAALVAGLGTVSSYYVGTLAVELTSDDYLTALQYLMQAGLLEDNPDAGDDFSIFLSPQAYIAALKTDVFINRQYNTQGDAIARAKIGDIYGMPTFVSNLMTSNTGGHDCVMMHRDCFALVVQKEVPIRSQYDIDNLGDAVVGWNLYGVAELLYAPETQGGGTATDDHGVWLKTV